MVERALAMDLAKVTNADNKILMILGWGERVDLLGVDGKYASVVVAGTLQTANGSIIAEPLEGRIQIPDGMTADDIFIAPEDSKILTIDFVDVQQGDGCVVESPSGKVLLVDGGENQMFARYLAARYRGTSAAKPREIEAIVVTHGDADHFSGLTQIHRSEQNVTPAKRLFIHPKRIFHNGIFKRPSQDANGKRRGDKQLLNDIVEHDGETYLLPLADGITQVDRQNLNREFVAWVDAIEAWRQRGQIIEQRLAFGVQGAFDFLKEDGVEVQVLGPLTATVGGNPALRFLGEPPKRPMIGHSSQVLDDNQFKGFSASHTINGHSIVLKLVYGGFSFLLAGDLNDQAERHLVRQHNQGNLNLRADVLKVPHHGSADFSPAFFEAVGATVSVISSGDESEMKEYIHPRATLVGSLGRYSRAAEPLVLCTELVAFFQRIGWSAKDEDQRSDLPPDAVFKLDEDAARFYAFKRTAYGLIKVRCDGKRLLIMTNSGKDDLKEAYAYELDDHGVPQPAQMRRI
jgi:beta-lactamase superfamily II metal-dependent hydrolase